MTHGLQKKRLSGGSRRRSRLETRAGGMVVAPTQMLGADTSGLFTGMFEVRVGDGCFAIRASG